MGGSAQFSYFNAYKRKEQKKISLFQQILNQV